eukprot:6189512-Pleurochrysis_carterae.AAC.2
MAALEAVMRAHGKLHVAIAEAAGREERNAALLAAGTGAAIGAAADDWRVVAAVDGAGTGSVLGGRAADGLAGSGAAPGGRAGSSQLHAQAGS